MRIIKSTDLKYIKKYYIILFKYEEIDEDTGRKIMVYIVKRRYKFDDIVKMKPFDTNKTHFED